MHRQVVCSNNRSTLRRIRIIVHHAIHQRQIAAVLCRNSRSLHGRIVLENRVAYRYRSPFAHQHTGSGLVCARHSITAHDMETVDFHIGIFGHRDTMV